jgi:hypothetical protein
MPINLKLLAQSICAEGCAARAYPADAIEEEAVAVVDAIERDVGPIEGGFNIGANVKSSVPWI